MDFRVYYDVVGGGGGRGVWGLERKIEGGGEHGQRLHI